MVGFCVIGYGGFGVSTLGRCVGGCAGAWGTAVLKMAASRLSAIVFFSPRYGTGMYGVGCCYQEVSQAHTFYILYLLVNFNHIIMIINLSNS